MVAPKLKSFDKLFRSGLGATKSYKVFKHDVSPVSVLLEKLSGAIVRSSMDDKDPLFASKNGKSFDRVFCLVVYRKKDDGRDFINGRDRRKETGVYSH